MKNQRMKTETRNFRFSTLAVVALMIAALFCSFTILVSAATTTNLDYVQIDLQNENGIYYKEYDGTKDVTVTLKNDAQNLIDAADRSVVKVGVTAAFNSANVAEATYIHVTFALESVSGGTVDAAMTAKYAGRLQPVDIPAKITPAKLTWGSAVSGDVDYNPESTTYTYKVTKETLAALVLNGKVGSDDVKAAASDVTATLNGIVGVKREGGAIVAYTTTVPVALAGEMAANYTQDRFYRLGFRVHFRKGGRQSKRDRCVRSCCRNTQHR